MLPGGILARRWELLLAARYLTTRRKQAFITVITSISVLGVAVGVAALIIGLSLATGIHQEIRARILGANAHITVFGPAGDDGIRDYRDLQESIRAVDGVVATAPVIFDKGLVVSEISPSGLAVFLKGVDPRLEGTVTDVAGQFVAGRLEDLDSGGEGPERIALGRELARSLGVGVGDRVRILVPRVSLAPWGVQPRGRSFHTV